MPDPLRAALREAAAILRALPDLQLDKYGFGFALGDGERAWTTHEIAAAMDAGNVSVALARKIEAAIQIGEGADHA